MNISGPFIRRPVMTTLLMAALALFGIMAYRQLPVSDLPTITTSVTRDGESLGAMLLQED